uniref:Uncharacterized protein n=1 Tax=Globodera rostochiensis TaxID=31243 RepID=A0A914HDH8_GLORO
MSPILILILCVVFLGANSVGTQQEQPPEPTTTAATNTSTPAHDFGTTTVGTLPDLSFPVKKNASATADPTARPIANANPTARPIANANPTARPIANANPTARLNPKPCAAAAALVAKRAPNGAGPRLCVNTVMALPPLMLGIVVPIVRANLLRPF